MERAFEIEELLREAGWLRALAASLVADPAAADDLVQDTWVAALRHPPRTDAAARPWLARVVSNLARNARRGRMRREEREVLSHDRRDEPRPDELAQLAEAQRLVAEAVTRLPEDLRDAIVLRYFRGLDSRAAGEVLGLSASAVRTRLQAALAELRADLDRRTRGGREAWAGMVAALARPAKSAEGGASIGGAASAFSPWVLPLLGGAGALGIAVVLATQAGGTHGERLAQQLANSEEPARSTTESSAAAPGDAVEAREIQTLAPGARQAPSARSARITGSVRVDGRPPDWPLEVVLTQKVPVGVRPPRIARTEVVDAQGSFAFEDLVPGWSGNLQVEHHTFGDGARELAVTAPCEGLALELYSDPALVGRLLEPGGRPCRSVAMHYQLRFLETEDTLVGEISYRHSACGDDGHFRIPCRILGDKLGELVLRVEAEGVGFLHREERFDPSAGGDLGDLVLERVRPIEFRVRATTTGTPIAGVVARVDGWGEAAESPPSDAEGRGTLGFAPDRSVDVRFCAAYYADRVLTVEAGRTLAVELEPLALLTLRLVGAERERAERVTVSSAGPAFVWDATYWGEHVDDGCSLPAVRRTPTTPAQRYEYEFEPGDEGRVFLSGLVPGEPLTIEARDSSGRVLAATSASVSAQEWAELEIAVR